MQMWKRIPAKPLHKFGTAYSVATTTEFKSMRKLVPCGDRNGQEVCCFGDKRAGGIWRARALARKQRIQRSNIAGEFGPLVERP